MVLDLNKALRFADADGRLGPLARRRYFALVDGIVGGEGDGPLLPGPRRAGLVVAGDDPLAVDVVCCHAMGFDWRKIPTLARAAALESYRFSAFRGDPHAIRVNPAEPDRGAWLDLDLRFAPAPAWVGHVER
jgi:hypothetical protein